MSRKADTALLVNSNHLGLSGQGSLERKTARFHQGRSQRETGDFIDLEHVYSQTGLIKRAPLGLRTQVYGGRNALLKVLVTSHGTLHQILM